MQGMAALEGLQLALINWQCSAPDCDKSIVIDNLTGVDYLVDVYCNGIDITQITMREVDYDTI